MDKITHIAKNKYGFSNSQLNDFNCLNQTKHLGSGRYYATNTRAVIDNLRENYGFIPIEYREQNVTKKTRHRIGYQMHEMILIKPELIREGLRAMISVKNSHDAQFSLKINSGIDRLICENGLMANMLSFTNPNIRHVNSEQNQEILIEQAIENANALVNQFDCWQMVKLDWFQAKSLAYDMAKEANPTLKENTQKIGDISILGGVIDDLCWELLNQQRKEDKQADLFTTYNVVQENIIEGNYSIIGKNGKKRKARPINSIGGRKQANQAMFDSARSAYWSIQ